MVIYQRSKFMSAATESFTLQIGLVLIQCSLLVEVL